MGSAQLGFLTHTQVSAVSGQSLAMTTEIAARTGASMHQTTTDFYSGLVASCKTDEDLQSAKGFASSFNAFSQVAYGGFLQSAFDPWS